MSQSRGDTYSRLPGLAGLFTAFVCCWPANLGFRGARTPSERKPPDVVRRLSYHVEQMSDKNVTEGLYRTAEAQAGYFTAAQALEAGLARSTLNYHARFGGRFKRVASGLYRLKYFPESAYEHIMVAWLPLRNSGAVVSHASALELHELSDIMPSTVHLTLPRGKRGTRPRQGVTLHTAERFPSKSYLRIVHGLPVTSVERTVVDMLAAGERSEQIEMAVRQALERGSTTPRRLRSAGKTRSIPVEALMETLLGGDSP